MENYRKILFGRIVLDLEDDYDEKEHVKGFIKLNKDPKIENVTWKNVVLRESTVRLTDWLIGLVAFTGDETFIAKRLKRNKDNISYGCDFINRLMFIFIIFVFIVVVVIFLFYHIKHIFSCSFLKFVSLISQKTII